MNKHLMVADGLKEDRLVRNKGIRVTQTLPDSAGGETSHIDPDIPGTLSRHLEKGGMLFATGNNHHAICGERRDRQGSLIFFPVRNTNLNIPGSCPDIELLIHIPVGTSLLPVHITSVCQTGNLRMMAVSPLQDAPKSKDIR
jgi:hypothetical protein